MKESVLSEIKSPIHKNLNKLQLIITLLSALRIYVSIHDSHK